MILVLVSNPKCTFPLQNIGGLFKQIMDCQSSISSPTEPSILAVESVNGETTETIQSVAKKLATIGDELSQSYELSSGNFVSVAKAAPSAVFEGRLDIVNILIKASRWKFERARNGRWSEFLAWAFYSEGKQVISDRAVVKTVRLKHMVLCNDRTSHS